MTDSLKKAVWFAVLFAGVMLNLFVMHLFQFQAGILEVGAGIRVWAHALLSIFLDSTVLLALSLPFCGFRLRGSLLMAFFLSLILAFVNVIYARFFNLYFSPLLLLEWKNAGDVSLIRATLSGFNAKDLYFPLVGIAYCTVWKLSKDRVVFNAPVLSTLLCVFISVAGIMAQEYILSDTYRQLYPNNSCFRSGLVSYFTHECKLLSNTELSEERQEEIRAFYEDSAGRVSTRTASPEIENVVFIIVESYCSAPCGLVVDGKEITPFLNSLQQREDVYFNSHMQENIVNGESSDGQLLYMTGLLPLRKAVTVSLARDNTLPGLPKQLGFRAEDSRILVPTNPTLWQQEHMNKAYGIGHCYSHLDYTEEEVSFLDDSHVFSYAAQLDSTSETPFFSLVLTLSMHTPYEEPVTDSFTLSDDSLPLTYRNYLIACHQMDSLMEEYIGKLEATGLMDNSLVIITGDHAPQASALPDTEIIRELPLYIINGGFDPLAARHDTIQQVDVYTSILDIMGSGSTWRGVGHSILSPYYTGINEESWQVSEDIILSDYFASN